MPLVIQCDCGTPVRGKTDDELVEDTQDHGKNKHGVTVPRGSRHWHSPRPSSYQVDGRGPKATRSGQYLSQGQYRLTITPWREAQLITLSLSLIGSGQAIEILIGAAPVRGSN